MRVTLAWCGWVDTIAIIVSSKTLSLIEFRIPVSSILFFRVYCSDMAWAFSSLATFSSKCFLTFLRINISLFSCSCLSNSRDTVSVKFLIWSQKPQMSASTTTLPFNSNIFFTNSGFFNWLMAISERSNKFWSPLPLIMKFIR